MSMIKVEVKWVIWEINERGEAESLIENDPFCWVINLPSTMNVETDLFFDNLVPKSGRIVEGIITVSQQQLQHKYKHTNLPCIISLLNIIYGLSFDL